MCVCRSFFDLLGFFILVERVLGVFKMGRVVFGLLVGKVIRIVRLY